MKQIYRDTFEALKKTHPIEAMILEVMIKKGKLSVVVRPTCTDSAPPAGEA